MFSALSRLSVQKRSKQFRSNRINRLRVNKNVVNNVDTLRLINASSEGDLTEVIDLIKNKGVNPNVSGYDLRTPMHLAAAQGHLEVVRFLVDRGADIHVLDRWGNSPMTDAVLSDNTEVVNFLKAAGGRIARFDDAASDMCQAAAENDVDKLRKLVGSGIDANITDYDSRTPLHLAAAEGNYEAVEYLISAGANVNVVDRFGNTPLSDTQRGVSSEKRKIALLLRENGAKLVDDIWSTRNASEFIENTANSAQVLCDKYDFVFSEIWVPNDGETEILCADKYYVTPSLSKECTQYHKRFCEGTKLSRGSGFAGYAWESEAPVSLDEVSENMDASAFHGLQEIGIKNGLAIPIRYQDRTLLILTVYTNEEKTFTKKEVDEITSFATGLIGSTVFKHEDRSTLFSGFDSITAEQMKGVFNYIVKHDVLNSKSAFQEVVWFYQLGVSQIYFDKFDTEEIARHVHSLAAAKRLAQASENPDDVFLTLTEKDSLIYFCPSTFKACYEVEKKIEKIISKMKTRTGISITYINSANRISKNGPQLSMYMLENNKYIDPECKEEETDIWKIASGKFLRDKRANIRDRYASLIENAASRVAPQIKIHDRADDGLTPLTITMRAGGHKPILRSFTELFRYHQVKVGRKFVETFANDFVVYTFYLKAERAEILDIIKDLSSLLLVPGSALTQVFLDGSISCEEYIYASSVSRFVYYFLEKRNEDILALEKVLSHDSSQMARLQTLRQKLRSDASTPRINEVLIKHVEIVKELFQDFKECTIDGLRNFNEDLKTSITQRVPNEFEASVLHEFITFNSSVLKTNFWRTKKSSIAFRMDPGFINECDYPEVPYGIFWIFGATFQGFHIRFRDVARGGIRLIQSRNEQAYTKNLEGVFAENYGLSYTQNSKNKDIPEFGSKGTILLHKDTQAMRTYAFKSYVAGLLDLLVMNDEIVDQYQNEEILFLGPDENTADLMEWAALYAKKRGYNYWKAFTTGKPPSLGGIPHDTYGMTTTSVHEYVLGCLDKLGLDETEVTKFQTGGPDGDLGSNEILISYDKTNAIVDGSGVLYDPKGLDRELLNHLANERKMVSEFPVDKLSEEGFFVSVSDVDVALPNGEIVKSGLQYRNEFHLNPLSSADLFVPCGGRPSSVTISNVHKVMKDGLPKWKIVVEGANLFITQEARLYLERNGTVLYKDASANKGGVTSSSLEVLAALALSDEEHAMHMQVKDSNNIPEFYQEYVKDIQNIIKNNARLEFEAIWKEHLSTGEPRAVLTDKLSWKINELNDTINKSDLFEKEKVRMAVLKLCVPPTLLNLIGLEKLLERVPENYTRAMFSSTLAARFVYKFGLHSNEFSFFDFLQPVVENGEFTESK